MPYSMSAEALICVDEEVIEGSSDAAGCNPTVTIRMASCSTHERNFIKESNIQMFSDYEPIVSDDITIDVKQILEEQAYSKISELFASSNIFSEAITDFCYDIVMLLRRILASESSSSSLLLIFHMWVVTEYRWEGEVPLELKYGRFEEFVGDDNKFGEKTCAICLDEFLTESQVKRMPCLHIFHSLCIDQWLSNSHSCPLCRTSLPIPPFDPHI